MASPVKLRLSFALNSGSKSGTAVAAAVVLATTDAILAVAMNKLKLKKKEAAKARLFVWRTGYELPREAGASIEPGKVRQDDIIAVSLGESYSGPCKPDAPSASAATATSSASAALTVEAPPRISGSDDAGRAYASLEVLWADQAAHHSSYYAANDEWWDADGYGGGNDEEAMIGDAGSEEDALHSLRFLDGVRSRLPDLQLRTALDVGAGVGRVTKHGETAHSWWDRATGGTALRALQGCAARTAWLGQPSPSRSHSLTQPATHPHPHPHSHPSVLLRRCERVCLLEACERWLKQSRRYLGNKRAQVSTTRAPSTLTISESAS